MVWITGWSFSLFKHICEATTASSYSLILCCCDVINLIILSAKIDARLYDSLSQCFLNFCVAVVQKWSGLLTNLSISVELGKRAQYLQYDY